MTKIALIGTHGTGKTTLGHELVAELKKKGIDADYLSELARECPFPINEGQNLDTSEWIIYNQYIRELEKEKKCEVLVCDRSVLDSYVYCAEAIGENKLLESFVKEKIKGYDLLVRIPIRNGKLQEDGVRSTNPEFQQKIDKKFDVLQKKLNIYPEKFSNLENTLNKIIQYHKNL